MDRNLKDRDLGFGSADDHEVLCEMNAGFHRSKVELIHRFLSDQEELNKRFAEYALNSDDDSSENEGNDRSDGKTKDSSSARSTSKPAILTEEDILQDLECRSILDEDNLSVTSAINSSLGSDIAVLDDEDFYHLENKFPRDKTFTLNNKNVNIAATSLSKFGKSSHSGEEVSKGKERQKEKTQRRKHRKSLSKKNVRPQTAAGIRSASHFDEESDILQRRLREDETRTLHPRQDSYAPLTIPHGYSHNRNSQNTPNTKTSWDQNPTTHPTLGGSAGKYRHPQSYSSAAGSGSHLPREAGGSPFVPSKSGHLYSSMDNGNRQNSVTRTKHHGGFVSIDAHPGSGNLSTAIRRGNKPVGHRDLMNGRSSYSGNITDRNVHSAGRRMFQSQTNNISDVPSVSKHKIRVLKLPPLEGPISVNKSVLGQGRLVGGAPKGNVTPTAEFLAG